VSILPPILVASSNKKKLAELERRLVHLGVQLVVPQAVGGGEQRGVVFWADGIGRGFHFFRVRRAQPEKVGHPETIKAIAFGETGDATQRGIELGFVGGARIKPNPHNQTLPAEERI